MEPEAVVAAHQIRLIAVMVLSYHGADKTKGYEVEWMDEVHGD